MFLSTEPLGHAVGACANQGLGMQGTLGSLHSPPVVRVADRRGEGVGCHDDVAVAVSELLLGFQRDLRLQPGMVMVNGIALPLQEVRDPFGRVIDDRPGHTFTGSASSIIDTMSPRFRRSCPSPRPSLRMARMKTLESVLVECPGCGRQAIVDAEMLETRLDRPLTMNSVGHLFGRLRCSGCGGTEVRIRDAAGRALIDPTAITLCRACGCPIPLPRLEALPNANLCTSCAEDGAKPPAPPPYPQPPADRRKCPSCGGPTFVRQNSEDQGFFLGCTSFPRCRWTRPLDE